MDKETFAKKDKRTNCSQVCRKSVRVPFLVEKRSYVYINLLLKGFQVFNQIVYFS
jgi:hypothetical protein